MDIYKLKFTRLQQEILNLLFIRSGISFNERGLANKLKVSPTAVSKSLPKLEKENLIKVEKDADSKRLSIGLNKDNPFIFYLKRVENLRLLYESGLVDYLAEDFPGSTIILFGSYSFGEDIPNSDVDVAIIGSKERSVDISRFEKLLERTISLQFYENFKEINKSLKENILNGIVLKGGVQL